MNKLKGAEAIIEVVKLYNKKVIVKTRNEKKYRIKSLDEKLRSFRTRREARIILKLNNSNVKTPNVLALGKYTIIMSFVEGKLMRDLPEKEEFMKPIGDEVKKMHLSGIIHGDLTPANIIINENIPFIIDFGLAR